ncbi:excinuclease ABC subunit UvrA [Mycolicibacterium sp. S2-37]|uniref:excinuclease ABC subunit UvrA n=1 Tax=Mycolicibacterium sp. S2-37 TaxID=2810297 RepID=UPI001A953DF5|nr:excinuclease ABC subunit UvrA [Mycolicibacterium sp. S2-37]MBO0678786.1 excinuclease ABC subunit UvrA [Mycolicibacterium sp. S2-37]
MGRVDGGTGTGSDKPDPYIRVYASRVHNLKTVDVTAPRDSFVAFTGVSGSGKSSLAFGTIYAEAQRRYFESVAPYARRLLLPQDAPKVDDITGLPPAVALQQRRGTATSRSTVGTVTTLSNLLRMLFSRAGTFPPGAMERLDSDAFSPNTTIGACPECHGLGRIHEVTEQTLVPDPTLSIRDGAVAAWPGAWQGQNLRDILITLGYDIDRPWRKLPKRERNWILFTEDQPTVEIDPSQHPVTADYYYYNGTFSSAERHVRHTLANSQSAAMRRRVLQFVHSTDCPVCGGSGLRPEALAVTFAGRTIAELVSLPLTVLADVLAPAAARTEFAAAYESTESGEYTEVATMIAADLVTRIAVLVDLGLGYLSLHRRTPTVSPGELQRLRLATQLRAGLFGVLYVLDEPSAGLHPADAEPLLEVLDRLRRAGNSLFVVEHDMDVVRRADWIVDVGPGAGELGGEVLYSGPVAGLAKIEPSVTRRFLFADGRSTRRSIRTPTGVMRLRGITFHNLNGVDVDIPLGSFVAVTGVSGSGKSTLVCTVLGDVMARQLGRSVVPADDAPDGDAELLDIDVDSSVGVTVDGAELIDRLVTVDQRPIGRTPRSNLATYTGLFDAVRKAFADTAAARRRGWSAGRFSFNVAEGRCATCQGEGFVAVELLFLPGTYATCPACGGARYSEETLEITYRGRTVADVLAQTVDEAADFLRDLPGAARSLVTLRDVGLGYLRLGQPATELSGGEAQRIKLATELQRAKRGHTLYVLDEPTTGLHPADVELLERQLHRLVDAGNTVVVAEHDMSVVAGADHVIDLGPGGGDDGGTVVAAGAPAVVAADTVSRTAPYLAPHLA